MKKISFNGLFEALSEKEMRNVIGGIVYYDPYGNITNGPGGDSTAPSSGCYGTGPSTCGGTCSYYSSSGGFDNRTTLIYGKCVPSGMYTSSPIAYCVCS